MISPSKWQNDVDNGEKIVQKLQYIYQKTITEYLTKYLLNFFPILNLIRTAIFIFNRLNWQSLSLLNTEVTLAGGILGLETETSEV